MKKCPDLSIRWKKLHQLLRANHLEGLVVTDNLDQYYLTDFFFYPDETVLLVHPKGIACFTRDLYISTLQRERPELESAGAVDRIEAVLKKVADLHLKKVGFDAGKEKYHSGRQMCAAGLRELPSLISQLRRQKDPYELKRMRKSNQIAYQAYEYVRPRLKTGMSEIEVAFMLEKFMREQGASGTSFDSIVCFGENSANPHHQAGNRKLKKEDAVLMDFGCIYQGYCSDITRCWWHGKNEPAEYTHVWKIVDRARRAGIKALKPGVKNRQIDATSRGVIEAAGYGPYFTHRTGHGVGLDIHEEPFNSAEATTVLQAGNTVTVEPGIYLPGKFGVRLEDTLAVTDTGATILTRK